MAAPKLGFAVKLAQFGLFKPADAGLNTDLNEIYMLAVQEPEQAYADFKTHVKQLLASLQENRQVDHVKTVKSRIFQLVESYHRDNDIVTNNGTANDLIHCHKDQSPRFEKTLEHIFSQSRFLKLAQKTQQQPHHG